MIPLTQKARDAVANWIGGNFIFRAHLFERRVIYDNRADFAYGCTTGSGAGADAGSGSFDLRPATRTRATAKEWVGMDGLLRSPEWTGSAVTNASYTDANMGTAQPKPTVTDGVIGTAWDSDGDVEFGTTGGGATGVWTSPYIDTLLDPRYGCVPAPYRLFRADAYTDKLHDKAGSAHAQLRIFLPFESEAEFDLAGVATAPSSQSGAPGLGTRLVADFTSGAGANTSRGTGIFRVRSGAIHAGTGVFNYDAGWLAVWLNLWDANRGTGRSTRLRIFENGAVTDPVNEFSAIYNFGAGTADAGVLTMTTGGNAISYTTGTFAGWKLFAFAWGTFGKWISFDGSQVATSATHSAPVACKYVKLLDYYGSTGTSDYVDADDLMAHGAYSWAGGTADMSDLRRFKNAGEGTYALRFGAGTADLTTAFTRAASAWPSYEIDPLIFGTKSDARYWQLRISMVGTA